MERLKELENFLHLLPFSHKSDENKEIESGNNQKNNNKKLNKKRKREKQKNKNFQYDPDKKANLAELREKLKATGDATLIEGNHWHDNRWGKCTCDKCQNKEGQNWLGKILMEIRETL